MVLKKLPLIVQALVISVIFFLIHFGIVAFLNKIDTISFLISYAFQLVMSLALLLAMIKIFKTGKEQLGFVFLGLSTLKVGISYFFATEYLFQNKAMLEVNKANFFITFLFFLSLDVYFTIRLLNEK
jgi:carbon starvation protein CstA